MARLLPALLFGVALLSGCATRLREAFIQERAGEYVYELPVERVWPHVAALLDEQGYSFKQDLANGQLVTEWKEDMGASSIAASYTRYLVVAARLDGTHCRVQFLRFTRTQGGGAGGYDSSSARIAAATAQAANNAGGVRTRTASRSRDLHAEWLLMQRVAPEDAEELRTAANARFR